MKTGVMLGLEFTGIAITGIMAVVRILVAIKTGYRTRSPRLERLGIFFYTFSCLLAIYSYATWCYYGILSSRWELQGASEETIKARLAEPTLLKVNQNEECTDGEPNVDRTYS
jgi:hypothetical protein